MIFERHLPAPPLDRFVEFLWIYEDLVPEHSMEKLLPDGSMELIIDLREHPKHTFDRADYSRRTAYRRSWLSGMQRDYLVIDASPGAMMGAHFRPGGAWPFFRQPISEFTDQVIELDAVLGSRATSIRDRLLESPSPAAKLLTLERILLECGGDRLRPDTTLEYALQQMLSVPARMLMRELAQKIGISHGHLIRIFDKRVGLSPKQLDRVNRFQQVIKSIGRAGPRDVDWAAVALDCGYYDQAHFIHEFQSFSGMTPATYLAQSWEYSNFIILDAPSATRQ